MQYDAGQVGAVTAYERGGQAILVNAATGNVAQIGNAQPVGAIAYGLAPSNANDQLSQMIAVQIDVTGTLAGTVNILLSLDGVNFYPANNSGGSFAFAAGTGLFEDSYGVGGRYITASVTGTSGAGTVTVSFAA